MTDHWNFLFHKAKGKYITFVGDDDAFLPTALTQLCDSLEQSDPDLVWTQTAGYGWPSLGSSGNFFQIVQERPQRVSLENARQALLKLDTIDVPTPYNYTLLKRQVALKFLQENPNERFFSSRVPDVNAGVKALLLSRTQLVFDRLTFISGASSMSNGLLARTNQNHPVTLEFNDPKFNPMKNRPDSKIQEVCPFGFVTYFEAIEESVLQLGEKIQCKSYVVAFRSVFQSSFPEKQLEISMRLWHQHKGVLVLAWLLHRFFTFKLIACLKKNLTKILLYLKIVSRRSRLIILRGPGINDTLSLIDFLEKNESRLSRRLLTKQYVE